jgi:transposase
MTLSHLTDNTFVGIDVGGAGLDVAWHRGDSAHYANRQRIDLRRDQRLLKTIKGIGVKSALGLLASVPELGRIDNKAAAALIGVAPFVRKSGTMSAPARIHGGRAAVRSILYMAAVTASRHNPVLRPFYERLIANGKPPKLALIAVLRRLVVFANAVLRSGQPWRGASAT